MHLPRANTLALVVMTNILPLLGVVLAGWDIYTLLIFYWLETAIVTLWTVITIAFHDGQDMWTVDGHAPRTWSLASAGGGFIAVHAGFFMAIHLYLMSALYGADWPGHLRSPAVFIQTFVIDQRLWPMLALIFVQRGVMFWQDRKATSLMPLIASLYMRIVVMQVVIIIGAWGVMLLDSGYFGLMLLVAMRTALDLYWPQILTYVLDKTDKANSSR